MNAKELRGRTRAELAQSLDEASQELFNLRFQQTTGQVKNLHRAREVRRDIARIKTVLRERELAAREEGHG
jgi:large subunit ribosomal protein L29